MWFGRPSQRGTGLAEPTPVRGDHEKQATKGERNPGDNPSLGAKPQSRDFGGDQPDTGEHDQQEPNFREFDARSMGESKHRHIGLLTVLVRLRNRFKHAQVWGESLRDKLPCLSGGVA